MNAEKVQAGFAGLGVGVGGEGDLGDPGGLPESVEQQIVRVGVGGLVEDDPDGSAAETKEIVGEVFDIVAVEEWAAPALNDVLFLPPLVGGLGVAEFYGGEVLEVGEVVEGNL